MRRKRIMRRISALLLSLTLFFGAVPGDVIYAAEQGQFNQEEVTDKGQDSNKDEGEVPPDIGLEHEAADGDLPAEAQPDVEEQLYEEQLPGEQPEDAGPADFNNEEGAGEDTEILERDADAKEEFSLAATDEEGNPLELTVEEIENPEEILEQVDFSRVSGELVWFKDLSAAEHEGVVTIEMKLENEGPEDKSVKIVHFPEEGEIEYLDAELQKDNTLSFSLDSFSPVAIYEAEDLFHFEDGDVASIVEWKEQYMPNGIEDLLAYDDNWYHSLYDYEKVVVDFLRDSMVELSEEIYDGQDVSECMSILESGVSAEDFFSGTIYEGITLEDLYTLQEMNWDFEDIYSFLCAATGEEMESRPFEQFCEEDYADESEQARIEALAAIIEKIMPCNPMLYALQDGDKVARMSVSNTGYSGTGHGNVYKLAVGGQSALCLGMGKSARNGFLYKANEGEYEIRNDGIGYVLQRYGSLTGVNYVEIQIAAWMYLKSKAYSLEQAKAIAVSMLNTSGLEEYEIEAFSKTAAMYYIFAVNNSASYYVFHSDNANAQDTGLNKFPNVIIYTGETPPPTPGSGETSITINIQKTDWQTEAGLEGCVVEIFEDGSLLTTVTTDASGQASYTVKKSEADLTGKSYTYSIGEITAPNGYVWQANNLSKKVSKGGTIEFEITNERTLGAVELVKYDTESESGTKQGDAALDGAVYGIYAAEDIEHQDKITGVIFEKDELVATATVGKSPKQNSDGYILNTDGTRHIENPGRKIAYEDTPGRTLFGDLELGSYYIREITPSEGYMFDEATYEVSFTYKDQMIKVETRNETAKEAKNELTADDGSDSHKVYSGDYVIKQGIQFIKTSDNTYQTELEPIEGAGFKVYLISDLSGVKNGSIRPINGTWGADDIMTFYDYDFTNEPTATVYKRIGHEKWTVGDTLWLTKVDGLNRYQVAEMFTDKDGRIETPELPYGTYVFVETTTPEYHVTAKPFIAYITQDGGVLYTDAAKQTVEKTYTAAEGIRYGDHKATKNREGRVLQKQRFINNTITKTFLRLVKADEEFLVQPGTYIEAEEMVRGTVLKEGSTYRLRCLTMDLSEESLKALNWKYDADGYMSYYDPNAKGMTGTLEHPFAPAFLKKDGKILDCYITLPQEVPIGTYEITELTAPTGYVVNGSEQTVVDTSSGRVNGYEIADTPWQKTIFTINNGSVYPDGQMGTNKYALCDQYGNLTVTVLQENQEQKGIIRIYKHGEQLSEVGEDKITLLDKLKNEPFRYIKLAAEASHKDAVFTYEDAPVEGASFNIVAAEDIYTQELQKDLFNDYTVNKGDYLIYHKGDVAATITTDRNGWGYASGLYIGKYKIVETVAGSGFVLNTAVTEFEITSQEQTVNFDIHDAVYKNERQKLTVEVTKSDKETKKPLAGAVFGLYAAEDIDTNIEFSTEKNAWIIRDTPGILIPEGTLVATCVTDEDGKGAFDEDLPLAEYVVRELEAPVGYLGALEDVKIDGSYDSVTGGQNVAVQRLSASFENLITRAVITKQDLTNGKELAGAALEVREVVVDQNGDPVKIGSSYASTLKESWVSKGSGGEISYFYEKDNCLLAISSPSKLPAGETLITKEGHLIEGLQPGRMYILKETKPAAGYVTAEEILFKLEQETDDEGNLKGITALYSMNGADWERADEDILLMKDDVTKLQISKKDITNGEELSGAVLEIYDEATGQLVASWTSTDQPHYIEKLPVGTYRLVEKQNPSGYGYAEEIVFEIKDTPEIQKVTMYDDIQRVDVEKSTISQTRRNDIYKYTIDEVRNLTDDLLDEFTLTDYLPGQVRITELWTGTYNEELDFTVEYQLNGSEEWAVWADKVSTKTNTHLTAPLLVNGKYITKFRFCFGTVPGRFSREEKPAYMVKVESNASGNIVNNIEVTAKHHGIPVKDKDKTVTRLPDLPEHKTPGRKDYSSTTPEAIPVPLTNDTARWTVWAGTAFMSTLILLWIFKRRG